MFGEGLAFTMGAMVRSLVLIITFCFCLFIFFILIVNHLLCIMQQVKKRLIKVHRGSEAQGVSIVSLAWVEAVAIVL